MYSREKLNDFDLIIDARSEREYAQDHVPNAINLPVVHDSEYAEVGTLHRTSPLKAYHIGVRYSMMNIARHLELPVFSSGRRLSVLIYCFRGGKRSRLWCDALETIGHRVQRFPAGWKGYREWVRDQLEILPTRMRLQILAGPTGCGKTLLLHALREAGEQILDLEALALHRGSVIGAIPGREQPSQKLFDSTLLAAIEGLDLSRSVWIESESKRIGRIQLPTSLHIAMQSGQLVDVHAPMAERVSMWRREYPHFHHDPGALVKQLSYLKPLVGSATLSFWQQLAENGKVDELFESVMTIHYDPAYMRSHLRHYGQGHSSLDLQLSSLQPVTLAEAAKKLIQGHR